MSGVFGIRSNKTLDVAGASYYALFALQHRGQESCGITVNDDGVFTTYKDSGLVSEVFTPPVLASLGSGNACVGQVRYGTYETKSRENAQPLVINHVKGSLAIAADCVLINSRELRDELEYEGAIFHTTTDVEVMSYVITRERLTCGSIEEAVLRSVKRFEGSFSMLLMSPTKLIAVRDACGVRPLCMGQMEDGTYVFASESTALDSVGAKLVRDVEPGEIIVISNNGMESIRELCGTKKTGLCCFEYIYFARPDSIIDGTSVHLARQQAGIFLAQDHPCEADVVIGVPDSGLDAAIGYAKGSGIPYGIGFIKNKYIGRTFIQPVQSQREDTVRIKLNAISETVKGKRVVLVDDSIVRGTTSARIVNLLREAGATEVHMRVSSPPFINLCPYGTDIDAIESLIANKHSVEEIREIIGVDSLGYLNLDKVDKIAKYTNLSFCKGCFTGTYPTPLAASHGKFRFQQKLSEKNQELE